LAPLRTSNRDMVHLLPLPVYTLVRIEQQGSPRRTRTPPEATERFRTSGPARAVPPYALHCSTGPLLPPPLLSATKSHSRGPGRAERSSCSWEPPALAGHRARCRRFSCALLILSSTTAATTTEHPRARRIRGHTSVRRAREIHHGDWLTVRGVGHRTGRLASPPRGVPGPAAPRGGPLAERSATVGRPAAPAGTRTRP
jgi:hypothetical protein